MDKPNSAEVTAVALVLAQGIGVWLALCPSLGTMRDGDIDDDDLRLKFRHAELTIAAVTVATGGIASVAFKSRMPIWAAVGIVAALAASYEVALRLEIVD